MTTGAGFGSEAGVFTSMSLEPADRGSESSEGDDEEDDSARSSAEAESDPVSDQAELEDGVEDFERSEEADGGEETAFSELDDNRGPVVVDDLGTEIGGDD